MKHALLAALILLTGCAAEHQRTEEYGVTYGAASEPEQSASGTSPIATSSLTPVDPKAAGERAERNERFFYAQGLERILLTNGMAANVRVHEEGKAGPVPALLFFGQFSPAFVRRAVTQGAVLERARALGFKSVEFIDRGPGGNYLFALSKTGPLPKCAAHNRLCL